MVVVLRICWVCYVAIAVWCFAWFWILGLAALSACVWFGCVLCWVFLLELVFEWFLGHLVGCFLDGLFLCGLI